MLNWTRAGKTRHAVAVGDLRTWIALCGFGLAGTTAAIAADLPLATKAPPPPVIASSWAGFYLGLHGGYAWGRNDFHDQLMDMVTFPARGGFDSRGGIVGGHAGYNWQYGHAIAGFEIDFSAADVSGSVATPLVPIPGWGDFSADRTDRLKYLGSARARLGWLAGANVLLYGTGGLAWERVEETERQTLGPDSSTITRPFDRFGWVAGAGIEVTPFGPNWVGRLEYLHYDFGAVQATHNEPSNFLPVLTERAGHQHFDVLRAGLSYKFGTPSGPMAAYASVPSAVAASWAGFYLGVHAGYAWGADDFTSTVQPNPPVILSGPKLSGGLYGGQAGYNWQFDRAVAGWELDFSSGDIGGSSQVRYQVGHTVYTQPSTEKVEVLGSLRGRLGWLPTENVLLYGTAGLGWERLGTTSESTAVSPGGSVTTSTYSATDRFGWVAGVGAETTLPGGNWIGRIEYLHYGFGAIHTSGTTNDVGGTSVYQSGHHDLDVVRAGLSYRFTDPAAVPPARSNLLSAAPASSWGGFYLGVHAGHGWNDDDFLKNILAVSEVDGVPDVTPLGGIKANGWLGGGHAGYNWQYGRVVAGVEADFSFADISGSVTSAPKQIWGTEYRTDSLEDRIKYVGTARARLGWAPTERVLLYATAGAAWERFERTWTETRTNGANVVSYVNTTPSNRFGGVVGAGAEWAPFGSSWIGRVEYLHYDFGKARDVGSLTGTMAGITPYSDHQGRQTIDVVRLGASYKFGSPK